MAGQQIVTVAVFAMVVMSCGRTMPRSKEQSFDTTARAALQSLERRDYVRLFGMFCYPDVASQASDERWLTEAVQRAEETLGTATNYRPYRGVPSTYFAAVGAGNLEFWERHGNAVRYTVQVEFSKRGRGWIFVDVTDACGGAKVKTVTYALPAEDPAAEPAIDALLQKLQAPLSPSARHIQ